MRTLGLLLAVACSDPQVVPPPNLGIPDAGSPMDDTGEPGAVVIAGGDVAGMWCGIYAVTGDARVPPGQTLSLCPDTRVSFADGVVLEVEGTLTVDGSTAIARLFANDDRWGGLRVNGAFEANGVEISGAEQCVVGGPSSAIRIERAMILACGQSLQLANGITLREATVLGGDTAVVTGGTFDVARTTLDLRHPLAAPDCTHFNGGGAVIDHVRFTGCHCPLHFSRASAPVTVTASIFDGATIPAMLASMDVTFTGNHFEGSGPHLQDIGGRFTANIANNYFEGGPPEISTDDPSQFIGADMYSTEPFAGVGP
jgi:hypothetical protein